MPGEVSFWPEADNDPFGGLLLMADNRSGRAKESGPSGPVAKTPRPRAGKDLFVVDGGGHRLFRKGELIPLELAALPRVDAVFADGVWSPAP